eukprot:7424368-Pyramimonas_sp.AAC.1
MRGIPKGALASSRDLGDLGKGKGEGDSQMYHTHFCSRHTGVGGLQAQTLLQTLHSFLPVGPVYG